MRLVTWIKEQGMTQDAFVLEAQRRGAKFSKHAVHKWCSGSRVPRPEEMRFIYEFTHHDVQPNDFYNLRSSEFSPKLGE